MVKYYVKRTFPEGNLFPTFSVFRRVWWWKDKFVRTFQRHSDAEAYCNRCNDGKIPD